MKADHKIWPGPDCRAATFMPLHLGLRRGQRERHDLRLEAAAAMRAVAEGLVGALAAAAQADDRPPGQVELIALRVVNFHLAFDAQRAVVIHSDLRCHETWFLSFPLRRPL